MLGEPRTGVRARASPSMLSECLALYGTSLAEEAAFQYTEPRVKPTLVKAYKTKKRNVKLQHTCGHNK
jgi:hypothetical protein